jgi:SnoaL-like domain
MTATTTWRNDIEQLIADGFHRVDSGQAGTSPELVTDDFTLVLPSMTLDHGQYVDVMAKRQEATYTTRHCASNLRLLDGTNTSVTVAFVVTAHRLEADATVPVANVADFVDEWVSAGTGWQLRTRTITPAFPVRTQA